MRATKVGGVFVGYVDAGACAKDEDALGRWQVSAGGARRREERVHMAKHVEAVLLGLIVQQGLLPVLVAVVDTAVQSFGTGHS